MSGDKHFNADKIFLGLFIFTALEVLWGYAFGVWTHPGKLVLWGGLLFFAFLKGWLIAIYFMHLKFEGWVVKSLLLPTPFLVMVLLGYVMPDVGKQIEDGGPLINPIGASLDPETGEVNPHMATPSEGAEAEH